MPQRFLRYFILSYRHEIPYEQFLSLFYGSQNEPVQLNL